VRPRGVALRPEVIGRRREVLGDGGKVLKCGVDLVEWNAGHRLVRPRQEGRAGYPPWPSGIAEQCRGQVTQHSDRHPAPPGA
jgi:hypothetical protein